MRPAQTSQILSKQKPQIVCKTPSTVSARRGQHKLAQFKRLTTPTKGHLLVVNPLIPRQVCACTEAAI